MLLEARSIVGGAHRAERGDRAPRPRGALFALDPHVVDEPICDLGLGFAVRDFPLVALRPDGHHLVLGRDRP